MAQGLPCHTVQTQNISVVPESPSSTAAEEWFSTRGHFAPGCHSEAGAAGIEWGGDRDPYILSQGNNGHFGQDCAKSFAQAPPRGHAGELTICSSACQLPGFMTATEVAAACPACLIQEPQKQKPKTLGTNHTFLSIWEKAMPLVVRAALRPAGV